MEEGERELTPREIALQAVEEVMPLRSPEGEVNDWGSLKPAIMVYLGLFAMNANSRFLDAANCLVNQADFYVQNCGSGQEVFDAVRSRYSELSGAQ